MNKSKSISTVEADLLFTKIVSKKNKKKGIVKATAVASRMELGEFIVSLKVMAPKLYPHLSKEEALLRLVEEKLAPLEK